MTVQDVINAGKTTLEDVINFIEGVGNWEQTRQDIIECTGISDPILEGINTLVNYTDDEVLNAEIIWYSDVELFYNDILMYSS